MRECTAKTPRGFEVWVQTIVLLYIDSHERPLPPLSRFRHFPGSLGSSLGIGVANSTQLSLSRPSGWKEHRRHLVLQRTLGLYHGE